MEKSGIASGSKDTCFFHHETQFEIKGRALYIRKSYWLAQLSSRLLAKCSDTCRLTHQMTVSLWKHLLIFKVTSHTIQASADPKIHIFLNQYMNSDR